MINNGRGEVTKNAHLADMITECRRHISTAWTASLPPRSSMWTRTALVVVVDVVVALVVVAMAVKPDVWW